MRPTRFVDTESDAERYFAFHGIGYRVRPAEDAAQSRIRLLNELAKIKTMPCEIKTVDQWAAVDEADRRTSTSQTYTVRRKFHWDWIEEKFWVDSQPLWEWLRSKGEMEAILEFSFLPSYMLSMAATHTKSPEEFPDMYWFPTTWEWLAVTSHEDLHYLMIAENDTWVVSA